MLIKNIELVKVKVFDLRILVLFEVFKVLLKLKELEK